MSGLFYAILTAASDIFGAWLFALTARGIAVGYFFLSPRRAAISTRFYRVLFAGRNRLYGGAPGVSFRILQPFSWTAICCATVAP